MTKDERIDEAFRIFMTGVAYLVGGLFCLVITFVHIARENLGWSAAFCVLTNAMVGMSWMARKEAMRIMPEPRDDDD